MHEVFRKNIQDLIVADVGEGVQKFLRKYFINDGFYDQLSCDQDHNLNYEDLKEMLTEITDFYKEARECFYYLIDSLNS